MRLSDLKPTAVALQELLRERGDYAHVSVRPRAGHLTIEVEDAQGNHSIIARATPLGGGSYGLSFRTHMGRWEPMPVSGPLKEIVEGLTGPLGPYLDRSNLG
jgi:hypothetical protein